MHSNQSTVDVNKLGNQLYQLHWTLKNLEKKSETIVDHKKATETNNHTNSISARPFFTPTGEWRREKKTESNCDERRVGRAYNSYGWKTAVTKYFQTSSRVLPFVSAKQKLP